MVALCCSMYQFLISFCVVYVWCIYVSRLVSCPCTPMWDPELGCHPHLVALRETCLSPPARAGLLGSHFAQDIKLVLGFWLRLQKSVPPQRAISPAPLLFMARIAPYLSIYQPVLWTVSTLKLVRGSCHWEQRCFHKCNNILTFSHIYSFTVCMGTVVWRSEGNLQALSHGLVPLAKSWSLGSVVGEPSQPSC